jgi:hypothetical protein
MVSSDPSVRRVVGLLLVMVAVAVPVMFLWALGDRPVPFPAGIVASGVAGGLGAGGLRLFLWPSGRRR